MYLVTLEAVRPRIPLTGIAGGDSDGLNWTLVDVAFPMFFIAEFLDVGQTSPKIDVLGEYRMV